MVQERQSDDWAHTMALIAGMKSLLQGGLDIRGLMPQHLRGQNTAKEPSPEMVASSWAGLRARFGVED